MTTYKPIAESKHFIVLDKYTKQYELLKVNQKAT